jgi:hypothetical protein
VWDRRLLRHVEKIANDGYRLLGRSSYRVKQAASSSFMNRWASSSCVRNTTVLNLGPLARPGSLVEPSLGRRKGAFGTLPLG